MTTPCRTGATAGGGGTRPRLAGKVARRGGQRPLAAAAAPPGRVFEKGWGGHAHSGFVCLLLFASFWVVGPFRGLTGVRTAWRCFRYMPLSQSVIVHQFCLYFSYFFRTHFFVSALSWVSHTVTVHFLLSLVNVFCNVNNYYQLLYDKLISTFQIFI